MASRATTVTAPQLIVLRRVLASPSGHILRVRGGFWTTPETPIAERGVPEWSTVAQTIASCERGGLLERAGVYDEAWRDNRRLTPAGEAIARSAPVPKLTPAMLRDLVSFAKGGNYPAGAQDLATLGYVEQRDGEWCITADGAAALARSRP